MKPMLTVLMICLPGLALAHPGHLTDVAGHDHWVAGVAIGLAVGVALWGLLAGKKDVDDKEDAEEATDAEQQDA